MTIRAGLLAIGLAAMLGGCMDVSLFGDSDDAAVAPNGCTAAGCPQAPQFCAARGYHPDTEAYRRCIISVEQNLRRQQ